MLSRTHDAVKPDLLASFSPFRRLGRRGRRRLAQHVDEIELAPGQVLMRSGAQQHALYLLVTAAVEVLELAGVSTTAGPGESIGAAELLERLPAAATAVVRTPGRALVMSRAQARALEPEQRRSLLTADDTRPRPDRCSAGGAPSRRRVRAGSLRGRSK